MIERNKLQIFHQQFDDLISIVSESNLRITKDPVDALFEKYANVFTKSYIVSACSILEAFVQDLSFSYLTVIEEKIKKSNIPRNVIIWSIGDFKKSTPKFEPFATGLVKKDVTDEVTGNFYKTIKIFEKVGIDLQADEKFRSYADFIGASIEKRNNIIHHNDAATDISLLDVIGVIENFKEYSSTIFRIVEDSPYFKT